MQLGPFCTLQLLIYLTGTFPIDTTKTRLQLQGQVIDVKHKEIRYRGMLHAFVRIVKEDGVKALYNGLVKLDS